MSSKEGEANEQLAKIFDLIASNPNNNRCADCDAPNPEWTSQGYGTFICLKCAGYHRSMGAHITTVRSLTLDEWSPEQFVVLERGGNDRFWEYLKNCRCIQRYHLPEVLYYTYDILNSIAQCYVLSDVSLVLQSLFGVVQGSVEGQSARSRAH